MNRIALALIGLAVIAITGKANALDLVVPQTLASAEGNTNNIYPFDIPYADQRYQQIYGASEFASFSSPITIVGLSFRPDGNFAMPNSVLYNQIDIRLSTSPMSPDALSATYSDNVGDDVTTVFSGPLTLTTSAVGPAGGPYAFDISIPLTTPFLYDPSTGSLLLDLLSGGISGPHNDFIFDAEHVLADSVSRLYGSGSEPTGSFDFYSSLGLVTKFVIAPEPATVLLIILAGFGILALRHR